MGVPTLSCEQYYDENHENPEPLMVLDRREVVLGECFFDFRSWGRMFCERPGVLRWDKYSSSGCPGEAKYVTYPEHNECIAGDPNPISTVLLGKETACLRMAVKRRKKRRSSRTPT